MAFIDFFKLGTSNALPRRRADEEPSLLDRLSDTAARKMERRDDSGADGAARHLLGEAVLQRRILIVADDHCPLHDHANWLVRHTMGVRLHPTLASAAHDAWLSCEDTILVVGIDLFHDMNEAMDALMPFRRQHPELVIVIASRVLSAHDFSCERAVIADASLRLPISGPQLALGLGAAISNHASIRSRGTLI
jgi:hypothetical protein